MKKTLLILLLTVSTTPSFSQHLENFDRLLCEGPLPKYFSRLLVTDVKEKTVELKKSGTKLSKKNTKDFLAVSNYGIQKYIRTGKVLYGDPLTNYANSILDKLKANSSINIDHIQLFTLKSNEINAFATHGGFIFITIGLWSRLENEAQLANIIAHEIHHITNNHSLESQEFIQEQISFGQDLENELSKRYTYSKDAEYQCDKEGFALATKTGYQDSLLISSLYLLARTHRPLTEFKVDYSIYEDEYFKIPKRLKLIQTTDITSRLEFDDKKSTHPDTKLRIERLKDQSTNYHYVDLKPDTQFTVCVRLAQFEMLNRHIVNKDFLNGMYQCLMLMKEFPNNTFLERSHAMLWYARAAEENTQKGPAYTSDFRVTQGELERFYFFFFKQEKHEISTLATRVIWEASLKYPKDSFLRELFTRVLSEFVKHEQNELRNFKTIDRILDLTRMQKPLGKNFSHSLALLLDNPYFLQELNSALGQKEKLQKDNETFFNNRDFTSSDTATRSLLLAKPLYSQTDLTTNVGSNIMDNEGAESKLLKLTRASSTQNNLPISIFGHLQDSGFTTKDYNDMSVYYDYLQENIRFPGFDFLPYNSYRISQISKPDSTLNSLGFISVQSITYRKSFSGAGLLFSLISVYGFPTYLRWQLAPKQYTLLYLLSYDLKTHNPNVRFIQFSNTPLNVYHESAQVYNALNQITAK
jgi:hypothetical protein